MRDGKPVPYGERDGKPVPYGAGQKFWEKF